MTQHVMPQSAPPDKQSASMQGAQNDWITAAVIQKFAEKLLPPDVSPDTVWVSTPPDRQSKFQPMGLLSAVMKTGGSLKSEWYIETSAIAIGAAYKGDNIIGHWALMIDDLKAHDIDALAKRIGQLPTISPVTSAGNYQALYVFDRMATEAEHAEMRRCFKVLNIGDPGARTALRLARLPWGLNLKNAANPFVVGADKGRSSQEPIDPLHLIRKLGGTPPGLSGGASRTRRAAKQQSAKQSDPSLRAPAEHLVVMTIRGFNPEDFEGDYEAWFEIKAAAKGAWDSPAVRDAVADFDAGSAAWDPEKDDSKWDSINPPRRGWRHLKGDLKLWNPDAYRDVIREEGKALYPDLDPEEAAKLVEQADAASSAKDAVSRCLAASLASGTRFCLDQNGEEIAIHGTRPLRMGSERDRDQLIFAAEKAAGQMLNSDAQRRTLVRRMEAACRESSVRRYVHTNTAPDGEGGLVIDLRGDGDKRVRVIPSRDGEYRIEKGTAQVLMHSPTGLLPQVVPEPDPLGADLLEQLNKVVNVPRITDPNSPDDPGVRSFAQILTALISWLLPYGMKVILVLGGEAGSGKTTTARFLVSLIHPMRVPIRQMPPDLETITLHNSLYSVCVYDNASHIVPAFSDAFAAGATGSGQVRRKKYADKDEVFIEGSMGVIFTSLSPDIIGRADLGSRAFNVTLERLPVRKTDADIDAAFDAARPAILHELFTLMSKGLASVDTIKAEWEASGRPIVRMLDAALVAEGMTRAMGWRDDLLIDALVAQAEESTAALISDNPVAVALERFAQRIDAPWEGSAADMLRVLSFDQHRKHGIPHSPKGLGLILADILPKIDRIGLSMQRLGRTKRGWIYRIEPMGDGDEA